MDGARKKMMKEQLLVIDEGDTIFGWSSPWPMWDTSDENSKGYTITTSYDGKTQQRFCTMHGHLIHMLRCGKKILRLRREMEVIK
ncbi:MAG: hypothetical protein ACLR78_06915 [Roseburia sp.]